MRKTELLVFIILIPLLIIGCATTPEEKEYRKNKEIVNSAIQGSKPKPVINSTTAVISETIRRQH
ncbi:MAG: hypothetical protein NTU54_06360 [Candidatus Omnitrophica bacterium]|nr:hypothetical protein [Candidatus Omnitrophota bacterium]